MYIQKRIASGRTYQSGAAIYSAQVFRFPAKRRSHLFTARTSTLVPLLPTITGLAFAPQGAIGKVLENSTSARSEELCQGLYQRRRLHPNARNRNISATTEDKYQNNDQHDKGRYPVRASARAYTGSRTRSRSWPRARLRVRPTVLCNCNANEELDQRFHRSTDCRISVSAALALPIGEAQIVQVTGI